MKMTAITRKTVKTLHLVLKGKWFDMIASGIKHEEYRDITEYWQHHLIDPCGGMFPEYLFADPGDKEFRHLIQPSDFKHFDVVCFHKGFTNDTVTFKCKGINVGFGKPEWGAPKDRKVFIIELGDKIEG